MRWMLLLVPIAVIAAAPVPEVDDLVRRGNAAFANKDYSSALHHYDQAEPRTTDPGLVAGNKAAALYQLALAVRSPDERIEFFRKAEQHYRCAAEGAGDARRLRARFGLANSIMQGKAEEAAAVREAIAAYRDCLSNPALDEGTADDARHNLEAAKLQLLRLQMKPRVPEKPKNGSDDKPPREQKPNKPEQKDPMNGGNSSQGTRSPQPNEIPGDVKDKQQPTETKRTTAGTGNIKTIFDETPSPPLTAEDAEKDLKEAVKDIEDQQKSRRNRSSRTPAGSVKDW